jgi:glycosyltransferase involved in cell wall biosynthesis
VREDVARFAPEYLDKTRIVEPVSCIPSHIYDADPAEMCRRYNLPDKFLYVPNQFWQHKNHRLVVEALTILRQQNVRPFIVMSGLTLDHRRPDYFASFLRRISEAGLRDQIAILGLVPREDVYGLIRQSIAIINPSLFEGYGLGVSETRWVGKRLLVSDLAAHREQNPPETMYFDPHSAEMLAEQMRLVWCESTPGPDVRLETAARSAYTERKRQYARDFIRVVQELVPDAGGLRAQVA